MSDRWEIREDDKGWEVYRNGRWYTHADDEHDAIGVIRGFRAKQVTIVEADGFRRTRVP